MTDRKYGVASNVNSLPKLTIIQEWLDEVHDEIFGAENEIRLVPMSALSNSNWGRLFDQFYRERIVYVRSNETLLLRFAYDYQVDLDRIKNERDLLSWALHLCEKTWMTTECLNRFIKAVPAIKRFKVHCC
jgi:hypothetical protein